MKYSKSKKKIFLPSILIFLGTLVIAFQNFTPLSAPLAIEKKETSFEKNALEAAMMASEEEIQVKKVSLNVNPEQLEKTFIKREKTPVTISDKLEFITHDNVEPSNERKPTSN